MRQIAVYGLFFICIGLIYNGLKGRGHDQFVETGPPLSTYWCSSECPKDAIQVTIANDGGIYVGRERVHPGHVDGFAKSFHPDKFIVVISNPGNSQQRVNDISKQIDRTHFQVFIKQ